MISGKVHVQNHMDVDTYDFGPRGKPKFEQYICVLLFFILFPKGVILLLRFLYVSKISANKRKKLNQSTTLYNTSKKTQNNYTI